MEEDGHGAFPEAVDADESDENGRTRGGEQKEEDDERISKTRVWYRTLMPSKLPNFARAGSLNGPATTDHLMTLVIYIMNSLDNLSAYYFIIDAFCLQLFLDLTRSKSPACSAHRSHAFYI